MSEPIPLRTQDGAQLFTRRWDPDGEPRAHLALLHGYGEHSGRYERVAAALKGIGVAVHAYDQRGHGRSPGKRGYVRDIDELIDDFGLFVTRIREEAGDKSVFLMGHSLGGMVLALYAERETPAATGLIFSSPFLALPDDVSSLLIALAGVLGTLTPWLPVASMDTSGVSRDPAVVEAYEADPLNYHGKVLARTGAQFNEGIRRAQAEFQAITAPLLVFHGSGDRLVPPTGSKLLHERCGSSDKTLTLYPDGYHEMHNEPEKEQVLTAMCDWIERRLQS